jgi:hypothetical protein
MTDITLTPEQLEALKIAISAQIVEEMAVVVEPVRSFEDGDYTLVCHTPECEGEDEPIPFTFVGIYDAVCGACGEPITDITPATN